jgi:hypothetical protein
VRAGLNRATGSLLLCLAVGCHTDAPTAPEPAFPIIDPGVLLPVPAPQHSGLEFPSIAWDLGRNAIVAPDRPGYADATPVRISLESRQVESLLPRGTAGIQQLRTLADGTILYTTSSTNTGETPKLKRVGTGVLTEITAVQFAVSDSADWVVFKDQDWQLMKLSTGERTVLPPTTGSPVALSNDGRHVAFQLPVYGSSKFSVLRVEDMTIRTIATADEVLDALFVGDELHLLSVAYDWRSATPTYHFFDRAEAGDSIALGSLPSRVTPLYTICGAWSRGPGQRVAAAIAEVRDLNVSESGFQIVRLDGNATVIGSTTLFRPSDCSVSPDGKWFVYGAATGYYTTGRLYLKALR